MTLLALQGAVRHAAAYLNQPVVKETVKRVIGLATFSFGILAAKSLYQEKGLRPIDKAAKISLILSAAVSPPGTWIISLIAGRIFRPEHLLRAFGPNTIFAVNPWHPRHVVSVIAALFAAATLPFVGKNQDRLCLGFNLLSSRPSLHLFNNLFSRL